MKLRPMTMEYADKMLEWKNYPETRKFAIVSHEEIKREDHIKWLEKNIQDFSTIFTQYKVCGAVRVCDNEISIWIDRDFWGQGLATKVIKKVSYHGLQAKIVKENIASMKVFIKAGYVPIKDCGAYYLFQC